MRIAILTASLALLVGCAENNSPQPGDTITLTPSDPPKLIAGEASRISILVDATNRAGDVRRVSLDDGALSARVEFFDAEGRLLKYEDIEFCYG